jgi:translation initiation factor IF-1
MAVEQAFKVDGVIIEALPNGTYRAELANGHRLLAFVAGKARESMKPLAVGDKVRLQVSGFDLSEGRVLTETETI